MSIAKHRQRGIVSQLVFSIIILVFCGMLVACNSSEEETSAEPDSDAFVDTAWKLTTDEVIDMEIATLTDLEFWITSDYLGAYYVGTGTSGDITVTTSNTFTQWGGEVDIPDPE